MDPPKIKSGRVQEMRGQALALLMTMVILLMTMTTQVLQVLREEGAVNQGCLHRHLLRNIGKIIIT
jgi:hypothetical protein